MEFAIKKYDNANREHYSDMKVNFPETFTICLRNKKTLNFINFINFSLFDY